jgi:RimJ/RimL family protein N-acetyltransferase
MFPDLFETSRLTLRPIEPDDDDAVFEGYAQDPIVCRFLVWRTHVAITETQAFIAHCLEASSSRTYAMVEREGGRLIGCLDLRREAPHRVGFGHVLARPWWGMGLMTEVLSEIVAWWSLRQDGMWRIGAVCDVENPASVRVMEKAGLVREGVLQRWSVHPNLGPEPRDCFIYALVR